jgi:hypothetical protein
MIYKALEYDEKPFIRKKSVVPQIMPEKNKYTTVQEVSSG